MAARKGEVSAARAPARIEPPIGASGGATPLRGWALANRASIATQAMLAARTAAEMRIRQAITAEPTALAAIACPAIAPQLPPAAMVPYRRAAWSLSKRSDMKLQNTETANRLNTLSQTKNTWLSSANEKYSRFKEKKAYTTGSSRARGSRAQSQPNTGTSA